MSLDFPYDLPQMGIYMIRCLSDGRIYVGQSRRIRGRWRDHLKELAAGRGCPKLQKAWDSLGSEAFEFKVLEVVPEPGQLCEREQYYIDTLGAFSEGFNTLPKAGSFEGYTPDAEARAKIGVATKKRLQENPGHQPRMVAASKVSGYQTTSSHRQKIVDAQKGVSRKPLSVEHREAISNAKRGRAPIAAIEAKRGSHLSKEAKRKIGDANRGRKWSEEQHEERSHYRHSKETLQKMSKARKGVPWTQARREAQKRRQQEMLS